MELDKDHGEAGNVLLEKLQKFKEATVLSTKSLHSQFYNYDLDHSGFLDHREFRMCLEALNIELTDDEIELLIFMADDNNNGQIEYDEFSVLLNKKTQKEKSIIIP